MIERSDDRGAAVVSGGGSGLGRAIALELGRRGFELALLGRRRAPLEETLALAGSDGLALACDVRDGGAVESVCERVVERWSAPEVLVPAAGVAHIAALEETGEEEFRRVLETNLLGVHLLVRALLPSMRTRERSWIFPIVSVAGKQGFPGWSAYCASKWGLAGLVAALRSELRDTGVQVTALFPGATETPIWDGLPGSWDRRRMIPPAEVARALGSVLDADPSTSHDEIHLGPAGGPL